MKYNLSLLSEEDFQQYHLFVKACFAESVHRRYTPELATVSSDWSDFPKSHQISLAESDSLGMTMSDFGEVNRKFHIWMTPSYRSPSTQFYKTLLHELCHGYAGLTQGHNAHWRRWYYRVLAHAVWGNILDIKLPETCYAVERCYNSVGDLMSLPIEAANKAKEEHDRVMDRYMRSLLDATCSNYV